MPFYVPREAMPQVDEADYPELLQFARGEGVAVDEVVTDPHELCAHQRVAMSLVREMPPGVMDKRVLTSVDRFLLDGNHRWRGHVIAGVPVKQYRFALTFEPAVAFLFRFPKTYRYADGPQPTRN